MIESLAQRSEALARGDARANPFDLIPKDWVPVVSFFAICKAALLKSPISLCAQVKLWIADGLTLEDARRIFNRLCRPEVAMNHQFDSQLVADLNAMVADRLRERRRIAEQIKRREAAADPAGVAGQVVRLADSFGMPE
jgi:hypothetical protein